MTFSENKSASKQKNSTGGLYRLLPLMVTLEKRIPVSNLDEAGREKVFEEIRLLSCMRCMYIVK